MRVEQLKKYQIHQSATLVETMKKIDLNAKGIMFVMDDNASLIGAITDGDIRRWLIRTGDLQGSLYDVMNKQPIFVVNEIDAKDSMEKNSIKIIPVVNEKKQIVDIIFDEEAHRNQIEKKRKKLQNIPVVIMAGGKGTRLYPYTKILPKPLIPIGEIPIMERIINEFYEYGVTDFRVTLNYKKNMIKSYFSDVESDYHLEYVEESKPLGTAGSLRLIGKIDKPIIVTNCDILIQSNYADIYEYHKESQNELTIVSALRDVVIPYGVIHSTENGTVEYVEEKPNLSYFINTGMYILNPSVLDKIPKDTFYHMTDVVSDLLKSGQKVGMYPISEDSFLDMGEFEEMNRMEKKLNLHTK